MGPKCSHSQCLKVKLAVTETHTPTYVLLSQMWSYQVSLDTWVKRTKNAQISGSDPSQLHMEVCLQTWQENPGLSLFHLHTWEMLSFFHLKVQFFTSNVPDLLRHSSCYFDVDCETVFTQRRGRGSKERMCASGKWREDLVTCQSQDNRSG